MQVYKLTDKNLQTQNRYQWQINEWHDTTGEGELCGEGWLHFYYSKELALFLNPLHARIAEPRMFVAEAAGQFKDDYGLKGGCTKLRIVEEIPVVMPSLEQRVKFGILCAKVVTTDKAWNDWADAWLDGSDRSADSAWAARAAAGDAQDAWDAWAAQDAARVAGAGIKIDLIAIAKQAME